MTRTDKIRLSISAETVAGTTNSAPSMLTLEHSDVSGAPSTPKAPSDIIRTDSRRRSHIALNRSASLSFSSDLAYPAASQGLRALMASAMNSTPRTAVTTSLSGADNGLWNDGSDPKIIRTSGSFVSDGWEIGDIGVAASRPFRVLSVLSGEMSVELPNYGTWEADATSVIVTRNASMIDNDATSETSYTVEVAYLDEGNMDVYTGQVVDSMTIGFAMGQKSTISFGLVGRDAAYSAMASSTVGIASATYTAPTESAIYSPASAIFVLIAGTSYPCRSASITTSRGLRQRFSTAGGATPDAIVPGRFTVSVQLSVHREVFTLMQQAKTSHEQTLWISMLQNQYIHISAGILSIDSATPQGGGSGSDVLVNVTGALTYSSTFGNAMSITL